MKPCPNKGINLQDCNCSYPGCEKKGICCECIRHHRAKGQLPACYFSSEVEATFDRSIATFIKNH